MGRLPFVDTHVHFHDMRIPQLRYEWLELDAPIDPVVGDDGAIRVQRYWADDFIAETRFQNVSKVIHVQAALGTPDPVEESRWLQAFADRLGIPHGIVANADLTRPDIADVLERHLVFPNVRGIRDLRYDDYLADPTWRRGYAQLERFGLICCDDPFLEEMGAATALARSFPGITLCVDHAAYPEHAGNPRVRSEGAYERWRDGIRELASAENVVIKISGSGDVGSPVDDRVDPQVGPGLHRRVRCGAELLRHELAGGPSLQLLRRRRGCLRGHHHGLHGGGAARVVPRERRADLPSVTGIDVHAS